MEQKRMSDCGKSQNHPRPEAMPAEERNQSGLTDTDLEQVSAGGDGALLNHIVPLEQQESIVASSDQTAVPPILLPPEG